MSHEHLNPLLDADYIVYGVGFAVGDNEPIEYALSTVKNALGHIWDRFPDRTDQRIFIGGKGNFRDKVATLQVYKGNRDPANRPFYYQEIREYLINHHGAEVVTGMEAEDACGIEQYRNGGKTTVIVGVDKDLHTVPGYHYNPRKETLEYIPLQDANTIFWKQVLTGDRTDNIRGIDGIGPKKADNLIAPVAGDWMKMREVVLKEYVRQHGDDGERIMHETAQLIFILRKENTNYDGSQIREDT